MTTVTKQQILAGTAPAPFEVEGLGTVLIRPLSAPEAAEVQATGTQGITVTAAETVRGNGADPGTIATEGSGIPRARRRGAPPEPTMSMDLATLVAGSWEANALACHYGLVDPALSLEEVNQIRPPQTVETIGREVMRRSGIDRDQAAALRQFRPVPAGSADVAPASQRDTAGTDTG